MSLESILIKKYRGVSELAFPNLQAVNVFVGDNNAGKTSVLEAAALLCRPLDPTQWAQTARNRDFDLHIADGFWSMFPSAPALSLDDGPQITPPIIIEGQIDDIQRRMECTCHASAAWESTQDREINLSLECELFDKRPDLKLHKVIHQMNFIKNESSAFGKSLKNEQCFTVTTSLHRSARYLSTHLSHVIDLGLKPQVVDALKLFDPEVLDIDIFQTEARRGIRITHKSRGVVDLSSFGEGMRRMAALSMVLIRARNGVLLIDELETGIHPSMMEKAFSWLFEMAQNYNVQLLTTTHSLETIDAMLEGVKSVKAAIAGYFLSKREGHSKVITYSHEKLLSFRRSGYDLR